MFLYQWYKYDDNTDEYVLVDGATGRSLTVTEIGDYRCVVTDGYNTSRVYFEVYIDSGFSATRDNDSSSIYIVPENSATLSVTATSDYALSYQWYYVSDSDEDNYEALSGKTSRTITVTEAGDYRCTVTDGYNTKDVYFYVYYDTGLEVSRVNEDSDISLQPGESVVLSVTATSNYALTYQWQKYNTSTRGYETISGATSASLTVTTAGTYRCVVSDSCNTTTVTFYVYVTGGTTATSFASTVGSFYVYMDCAHKNVTYHKATAATCTKAGTVAYYKCDDCGKTFSDAAATKEITNLTGVAATGHKWSSWKTTSGSPTQKRTCSVCGQTQTKTVVTKGKTYTVGNFKVKVLNASTNGKGTVAITGLTNKKLKKVVIPATLKLGSVTFKVTQIGKNAFKNCKKLITVTIGNNVTTIGKNAFYGCKKLKTITIKSKVLKSIGNKAFTGIKTSATFKVPSSKKKLYKKLLTTKKGFKNTMKVK